LDHSRSDVSLRYTDVVATENHDSFFQRIDPFFSPRELRKIDLAYMLAKYAHRAQTRNERDEQGVPVRYFEHVRRATLIGLDEAKIVRLDTTIASFLHDTREDTRLGADQIEDCFGSEVCNIVKVLSKMPKEGYLDRFYMCPDWRPPGPLPRSGPVDHDVFHDSEGEPIPARVRVMNDDPVESDACMHPAREPRRGATRDRVAQRHVNVTRVEGCR
jgi:hypothetical protein